MRKVWTLLLTLTAIPLWAQDAFFEEVGERSGLALPFCRGVSVMDYNGDGFDDLFIARQNDRTNLLYRNNGDGTFEDVSQSSGIGSVANANQSTWADIDNDGDLDFYLGTMEGEMNRLFRNKGDGTFEDITAFSRTGIIAATVSANWADINGDGLVDLFLSVLTEDNKLFINNGNGSFRDATAESGLGFYRLSMGAVFLDYDNDGDQDLYVSHDAHEGNYLYRNNGQGQFTDVSQSTGIYSESEGMGVSIGDFNNDGFVDLYLTNRLENMLFRNNGGTSFTEIGGVAGVDDLGMGWGVSWLDFDNDGLLDIYIGNDTHYSDHPNVLYKNNGDETFSVIEQEASISSEWGTHGTAITDIDHDGDLDIYTANRGLSDKTELFLNQYESENNWLIIRLKTEQDNRMAIGAKVEVTSNDEKYTRYMVAGTSWGGDDSKTLQFGLGDGSNIQSVKVTWPDGTMESFEGIATNKAYSLNRGGTAEEIAYQAFDILDAPDDDGGVVTSIDDDVLEALAPEVFPNPTARDFTLRIHMNTLKNVNVNILKYETNSIYKLYNSPLGVGEHHLELLPPAIAAGLYLLQVTVGEDTFYKKLLVRD